MGGNPKAGTVGSACVVGDVGSGEQCFWQTASGTCVGFDAIAGQSSTVTAAVVAMPDIVHA